MKESKKFFVRPFVFEDLSSTVLSIYLRNIGHSPINYSFLSRLGLIELK